MQNKTKVKYGLVKRLRGLYHRDKAFRADCHALNKGAIPPVPVVTTLISNGYGDCSKTTLDALATFVGQEAAYQSIGL